MKSGKFEKSLVGGRLDYASFCRPCVEAFDNGDPLPKIPFTPSDEARRGPKKPFPGSDGPGGPAKDPLIQSS